LGHRVTLALRIASALPLLTHPAHEDIAHVARVGHGQHRSRAFARRSTMASRIASSWAIVIPQEFSSRSLVGIERGHPRDVVGIATRTMEGKWRKAIVDGQGARNDLNETSMQCNEVAGPSLTARLQACTNQMCRPGY
jgi:hypothetical protein